MAGGLRAQIGVNLAVCALVLIAGCFPDYAVGGADAAIDSGNGGDSAAVDSGIAAEGSATDSAIAVDSSRPSDAGGPVLVGSTRANSAYPAPNVVTVPYGVQQTGDLLVLGTYISSPGDSVTSITDSLGTTFHSITAQTGGTSAPCSGNGVNIQIWYGKAGAGGQDTISLNHPGTDAMGVFVLEYAGLSAGGTLDGTSSASGSAPSTAMTAGMLATTGAREVAVALFVDIAAYGAMVPGGGFASEQIDAPASAIVEDAVGIGPGPHEATATLPPDSDAGLACWVAMAAAFE